MRTRAATSVRLCTEHAALYYVIVKKTKRGNDVPMPSPEDLLTGERDGSEHAKVLLSPLSYGRTERAQRMCP